MRISELFAYTTLAVSVMASPIGSGSYDESGTDALGRQGDAFPEEAAADADGADVFPSGVDDAVDALPSGTDDDATDALPSGADAADAIPSDADDAADALPIGGDDATDALPIDALPIGGDDATDALPTEGDDAEGDDAESEDVPTVTDGAQIITLLETTIENVKGRTGAISTFPFLS